MAGPHRLRARAGERVGPARPLAFSGPLGRAKITRRSPRADRRGRSGPPTPPAAQPLHVAELLGPVLERRRDLQPVRHQRRGLRILAPGSVPVPEPADVEPVPAAVPAGPVRTRETASDGYRRALAAHQEAAPPRRVDLAITEARERQTAALRALSARAFPETDVPDEQLAPIETARAQRRQEAEATRLVALRRARRERAGRTPDSAALGKMA